VDIRSVWAALLHFIRRILLRAGVVRRKPGSAYGLIAVRLDFDASLPKDLGFD